MAVKLVSDVKGEIKTEGFFELGAEENIWAEEGLTDRRMEKTA
jgi:hypothetical protein